MNSKRKPVIFTAQSKYFFFARKIICKYVIERDLVPINPFTSLDYFLSDSVDRDLVRECNWNYIRLCQELWVFGPIADGVLAEIFQAVELKMPVVIFSLGSSLNSVSPIGSHEIILEDDVDIKKEDLIDMLDLHALRHPSDLF